MNVKQSVHSVLEICAKQHLHKALTKYISKKGPFEKVYYTGDGGNDVCPALRLTDADIVFVRKNYAMDKILKHGVWKGQTLEVKARIVYWENAKEIEREMIF